MDFPLFELAPDAGMTSDEIAVARALRGCSFVPGSSPKRFVRQVAERDERLPLSEKQRAYLWAIAWSWRRQLPRDLVEVAYRHTGGVGLRGEVGPQNLKLLERGGLRSAPPF